MRRLKRAKNLISLLINHACKTQLRHFTLCAIGRHFSAKKLGHKCS
jgi:hypothetical protein